MNLPRSRRLGEVRLPAGYLRRQQQEMMRISLPGVPGEAPPRWPEPRPFYGVRPNDVRLMFARSR